MVASLIKVVREKNPCGENPHQLQSHDVGKREAAFYSTPTPDPTGPKMSMATNSRGPLAGNNLRKLVLFRSVTRFFANTVQCPTVSSTSLYMFLQ
jgi:hypothetical protein